VNQCATAKLQAQLDQAEAAHKRMVAANAFLTQGDRAGLIELGFTEKQIARIVVVA
jgi:hypothetical protein